MWSMWTSMSVVVALFVRSLARAQSVEQVCSPEFEEDSKFHPE
jgi:hypothetical protein